MKIREIKLDGIVETLIEIESLRAPTVCSFTHLCHRITASPWRRGDLWLGLHVWRMIIAHDVKPTVESTSTSTNTPAQREDAAASSVVNSGGSLEHANVAVNQAQEVDFPPPPYQSRGFCEFGPVRSSS